MTSLWLAQDPAPAGGLTRTQQLLADDPLWLIVLKVVALFAIGVVLTLFMINWERKVVGRMQQRPGPNRTGPGGWLQSLADGLKLAFKEDIMPVMADKRVYFIAPIVSTIPAFVAFSVIPFGGEVVIFGEPTVLQLVDLPVGVLVVLACSSIGVYGIVLGGWASGSPYPLLAALRSAASNGYGEPDAQPPSTMPYTPIELVASTTSTPTGRSVSCSTVRCPKIETSPPNGITENATNAGMVETIGAMK